MADNGQQQVIMDGSGRQRRPERDEKVCMEERLSEVKKLHNSLSPVEQKKSKAVGASTTFRAFANRKNTLELEKLKADGLATIFHHQGLALFFGSFFLLSC